MLAGLKFIVAQRSTRFRFNIRLRSRHRMEVIVQPGISDIHRLKVLLRNLPDGLPFHSESETWHPQLVNWSISEEWAKDVEKDGAVNRELESSLGPRNRLKR